MSARPESVEMALAWLKKAGNDLEAARRILAIREDCPYDTVCFHCQQAAEKSLKAWMTACGQAAPRTHDLEPLYAVVEASLTGLPALGEVLALNPYGVQVRYLAEWLEPSEPDAIRSLATAEAIHRRIQEALRQLMQ